ncbi:zinc ribbon domain-containing protein [Alloscardovia omnicolens]|uniref:zinc ribbon domain-containing protein n=1 Tax=Alloscardovia omnicolens TaxID=419015 RepID=UPI00254F2247|nr:zinc ribbon domain-containing protein [Alloscardovia omnicolens]MDK6251439.1 zinc ribbon domain-containing protein [Alloscardovia omnicolens]MDK6445474.1 zinc ribbon domain-containing protein [Alloscardovia omnicolens]
MFCTQCGAKLVAGAKFCTKCGKPVQSTQPQQQHQVSAPTPAVTPPVEPVAAPAQPAPSPASFPPAQSAPAQPAQSETPSSNKSKKKFIYAVIAVIAVIAVAVGGFFVYKTFFSKNGVSAQNAETSGTKFLVKLDKKWSTKSTPVLLHIISTDMNNDVDMYRAVRPAQGKDTRGSASVQLSAGEYDVEYVSPVNADGSIYKTPEDLSITVDKKGSAKGSTSASDFAFIAADDADASDIEDILSALKEAAKDKKSGVTKKDIAIASKAASANPDSARTRTAMPNFKKQKARL